MKIVHLNTYKENGGAGRACQRLNKALREEGVDSEVWINFSFNSGDTERVFSRGLFGRAVTAFGIIFERIVASFLRKKVPVPFSFPVWGRDISRHPALAGADVIHIHWINHGFLRPKDLAALAELGKPVIWTFHDSNAFTGGCHVRYTCDHFERECGNCPVLKNPGAGDWSHKIWKAKEQAYRRLGYTVIAPSRWMESSVRRSKLAGLHHVYNIPNTLDTQTFRPLPKGPSRKALGLPEDKFIILSGFMPSRNDLHKGTPYLLEALGLIISKYGVPREEVALLVFGNRDAKNVPEFPVAATFLGTIAGDDKLTLCYSAADVFVTPSLEDNLPNTVMESLSCGTPVVAFTTGGIPDMVDHLQSGFLAEYRSADDLAQGIQWVYNHHDRQKLGEQARSTVMQRFSEKVIARQHISLYNRVLDPGFADFQPVLTVITVVYNDVRHIERTIRSVTGQTWKNIEYLVIDGGSTDGTLEIIKRYAGRITGWVSEPDQGIYDAMNKGLRMATGDYVLFMNSGDEFYSPATVRQVFSASPDADIYYGETEMLGPDLANLGRRRHASPEKLAHGSFKYGMSVSHQAIYIRRALLQPFDAAYQLSADIDSILHAIKRAGKIVNTRRYVAKYLVGGMSKKKHRQSLKERFGIFSKHYGLLPNLFNHAVIATKLAWYYLVHRRTND
ncbi:glycosyltransferase [Hufsiella ginkgonis]|uniref:glycosyltransferase n=1 Tax=Hufsiella ginkgonis TaxID=2695274 RepID=UPI0034E1BEEF